VTNVFTTAKSLLDSAKTNLRRDGVIVPMVIVGVGKPSDAILFHHMIGLDGVIRGSGEREEKLRTAGELFKGKLVVTLYIIWDVFAWSFKQGETPPAAVPRDSMMTKQAVAVMFRDIPVGIEGLMSCTYRKEGKDVLFDDEDGLHHAVGSHSLVRAFCDGAGIVNPGLNA
jgi:hypothetical protein